MEYIEPASHFLMYSLKILFLSSTVRLINELKVIELSLVGSDQLGLPEREPFASLNSLKNIILSLNFLCWLINAAGKSLESVL